ncbi:glycoside hydrolase family 68 protein [Brevibacillus dissolubilis]|uniref:glycoside hydrolase family 68 protein n=1 Tax=Brevibacillus dissolubilis TaxID=1844116 RepID=UPI001116C8F5|nr:glycoside hydrolase family 68 protein [Brevibacillus dissolubilis]
MNWKNVKLFSAAVIGASAIMTATTGTGVFAQGTSTSTVFNWSREAVSHIDMNENNTAPVIQMEDLEEMAPEYHVWDTWPLQDRNGNLAVVNGYKIIFALTVPSDVIPGKRHDTAGIRYFYSKDGQSWKVGGLLFNDGQALGSRQWAGSAIVDKNGKLHIFYTATGRKNETHLTYEQRLATATAEIKTTDASVTFANWSDHKVILEPDGQYYQTQEQAGQGESSYAFRDPYFFQDPKTGEEYLLFEANSAGSLAQRTCQPEHPNTDLTEESKSYNGSIGVAKAVNDNLTEFQILPPVLEANCVNEELERPGMIVKGNRYYLFTKTHHEKFALGLDAPEGLYGFTSASLMGGYQPLNGSGLVIANPQDNPYQAYSWMVMPNGTVISFVNYVDVDGQNIHEIGEQSPDYQREHFGGMLAPSLHLSITGDQTKVVHEKKQGVFH